VSEHTPVLSQTKGTLWSKFLITDDGFIVYPPIIFLNRHPKMPIVFRIVDIILSGNVSIKP